MECRNCALCFQLNRPHALILLQHPEKWACSAWLSQFFENPTVGYWGAPDEYLFFHALSEVVGMRTIQTQINDGNIYPFPVSNVTPHKEIHGDTKYRHTWACWMQGSSSCNELGIAYVRRASPAQFVKVNAAAFERMILSQRSVWFARKFSPNCRVDFGNSSNGMIWDVNFLGLTLRKRLSNAKLDKLPRFDDYLVQKLAEFKPWVDQDLTY